MKWYIEASEWFKDERLISWLKENGRDVLLLDQYPPNIPIDEPDGDHAVAYGSTRMCAALRTYFNSVTVIDNYNQLQCSNYLPYLYQFMKRKFFIIPMGMLPIMKNVFGSALFVRPNSPLKPFDGKVISSSHIDKFLSFRSDMSELVVVSEVVRIGSEYRCFIRGHKVIASSPYSIVPGLFIEETVPKEVIDFAEEIAREYSTKAANEMYSIDVGRNGHMLRLIELNGTNSAGLYNCDIKSFVENMEDATKSATPIL